MTDQTGNGRATIREVYALVGEVDEKVDKILECIAEHETRVTVLEKTCEKRPEHCEMKRAAAVNDGLKKHAERNWTKRERWMGVGAFFVAVFSVAARWLSG